MNLGLTGKAIAVLGSSRGIGKGIARSLLEEQALVTLTGRDMDSLNFTWEELNEKFPERVLKLTGDLNEVATLQAVERLTLEKWGRLDGIIVNAGAVRQTAEWNIAEADWQWYFNANFSLAARSATHFIPRLQLSKGSITFISSIAGLEDIGAPMPYSSSKAALIVFAKTLSRRLAQWGIRVNVVAPGNILFPGGNWDKRTQSDQGAVERMLTESVPLGRFGSPEDIGNIVAFLASERAGFITGSCLVVDGGQTVSFI